MTEVDSALRSESTVCKFLIVDAAEPTGVEAARKTHFEFVAFILGRSRCCGWRILAHILAEKSIERLAVDARNTGDVFGTFQPPFDFQ